MTRPSCSMAPLVHARRDGRLLGKDERALGRHLASCAECAALARDLDRIADLGRRLGDGVGRRSDLEQRRARLRLLREAAASRRPRAPQERSRLRGGVAAAAAVIVATVVTWLAWPASGPVRVLARWNAAPATGATSPAVAATITTTAGARYARHVAQGVERVDLDEGTIDLHVPSLRPAQRFLVATADAEVEVRGTEFSVTAHARHLRAVVVRQGRVEVRRGGQTVVLDPGQSWRVPDALPVGEASAAHLTNAAVPSTEPAAATRRPLPGSASSSVEVEPSPGPEQSQGSAAFAAALALLNRRHYEQAAASLRAFARRYPADPRAEDAMFLVIVAQPRAGRQDAAAVAARQYLEQYPNGDRRSEVEAATHP